MNESHDHFDTQLGRLLDDAAASFHPTPDVPRLQRMMGGGGARRRGAVIMFSAAACLALVGGGAFALHQQDEPSRIAPAGEGEHPEPTRTTEPTTTHGDEGEHDGEPTTSEKATEPTEPPRTTEPKPTEPPHGTEPPATEPKPTEPPHTTEPKATEPPHTTEPKTTEPKPTEPTEPPPTEPTTTEPSWEWSVHQVYGSCDAAPPYDVFWGTTAPGAKVVIESAYGRKVGYANEAGQFELRIEFPESPVGEPFQVWVVSEGHTDDFWFTRTG